MASTDKIEKTLITDFRFGLILFTVWFLPKEALFLLGMTTQSVLHNWMVICLFASLLILSISYLSKRQGLFRGWLKGLLYFVISLAASVAFLVLSDCFHGRLGNVEGGVFDRPEHIFLTLMYTSLAAFAYFKK